MRTKKHDGLGDQVTASPHDAQLIETTRPAMWGNADCAMRVFTIIGSRLTPSMTTCE